MSTDKTWMQNEWDTNRKVFLDPDKGLYEIEHSQTPSITAEEIATLIEKRRYELEQELLALTGYHVHICASLHGHIDNTNALAEGAIRAGYKPHKGQESVWLRSEKVNHLSGDTCIFLEVKG